jgi:hypothetical protein
MKLRFAFPSEVEIPIALVGEGYPEFLVRFGERKGDEYHLSTTSPFQGCFCVLFGCQPCRKINEIS